jgi:glutaminyl-tRNA synthetase
MSDASRPATSDASPPAPKPEPRPRNFIQQIIDADCSTGKWGTWPASEGERAGKPKVHTRFPPEPNGYLHMGHAKSICLNSGLASEFGGKFNLRFDDTNPAKEEQEYVDSIIRDVLWLGGRFDDRVLFSSNYFQMMYDYAEELIKKGKAYVCDMSAEEMAKARGNPSQPATPSPNRNRAPEESLDLLRRMRKGEFPDGARTLRAKIDLASPNFNLRDPVMYRILHEHHHNTGGAWCIYPMYDWAHGLEDSTEGITHSICTLEFEAHRPLYDWYINSINEGRTADGSGPWGRKIHHAQQIEFAKLRPTYTILSKRNLLKMVQDGLVHGWDDPRMPTIAALRRRGFTPRAIQNFCDDIGVTKFESTIDITRLENAVREDHNKNAPRAMAVLKPLKVIIENWPQGKVDMLDFVINPEAYERAKERGESTATATRQIPFSGTLYIEHDDFMEVPPKKFFRLAPGVEVRLRWAYFIKCVGVDKDAAGNITAVRCTYDPATRGGDAPPGPNGEPPRKVKATIHWVSAAHAADAEVRLFDRLFSAEEPGKRTGNYLDDLNPSSLEVIKNAKVDPFLLEAARYRVEERKAGKYTVKLGHGDTYQFERLGYFTADRDSGPRFGGEGKADALVFNRTLTLKDAWAKESQKA